MTRLNVEPAAPSVRLPEPASSSTAPRGETDRLTVFDTHLQRAQTPEPINKLRPNAPAFAEPARPSADAHRPQKPNEPASAERDEPAQRDDRRRAEIDERDHDDERHDESLQPANTEQQEVTTAESNGNERHEDPKETTVDVAQHGTEDALEAQVVIDEAATAANLTVLTVDQDEPSGDPTGSTENDGSESSVDAFSVTKSSRDEPAAKGIRSGPARTGNGNDPLTGTDATTEDPVSVEEVDPISGDADVETGQETDAESLQRDENGNSRQGRHVGGAAEQVRRDIPKSRFSDRADNEASDTSDRQRDAETSAETAKSSPDVGTPHSHGPRRQNATHPNLPYGPLPPALDATSPAERSTLTAAGQAFTHDESGRQSTSDSASQATDEVAAAGGDPAGEGRARGNPQDGRANLPPQLRAQLGSRSSGEPTLGDGLSSVQRARFVQRVGNAFRMASERGGIVRLRLSPAELGSLRLEITMRDGAMIARMEVETSQARSTIVDNLGMLRQRLAEHNVEIERLDVEVREQGAGETPEQNDRSMAFGHNRRNSSARGNNTDSNNIAQDSQELRVARRPDDNSKLNLVI